MQQQRYREQITVASAIALVVGALGLAITFRPDLSTEIITTYVAFAALITVSDLLEVTLSSEVRYTLSLAPGLGLALWGLSSPVDRPAYELLLIFALGLLGATVVRGLRRKPLGLSASSMSMLVMAGAAAAYGSVESIPNLGTITTPCISADCTRISVPALFAMLLVLSLGESVLRSLKEAGIERLPFRPRFVDTVKSLAALHLSILSVGALLALAYPSLGKYRSFPLFLAPLAATQYAFRQFASIKRTYLQTIRALSKVPELAGFSSDGHSRRVADLSVSVARELGLTDSAVEQIEYAALLHDIGHISMTDPEDTFTLTEDRRKELAAIGSNIVRGTGHFPAVAEMISRQYDPYRRPGENVTDDLPSGSKIIKACSAYDDLTDGRDGASFTPWNAIERLHIGTAYDWEPTVVQALMRVLEKRGVLDA